MFSITTIYVLLFVSSGFFLYVIKLIIDEIGNIVDKKFIDYLNKINKLEKENIKLNNDLKNMNTNSTLTNKKSSIPIIYGCFH